MQNIIILFLLFTASAQAADEWTDKDTAWEATYLLLHAIDWSQTIYIASHPTREVEVFAGEPPSTVEYQVENNLILGRHPSRGRVNTFFLLTGIGHVAAAVWLPTEFEIFNFNINSRRWFQAGSVFLRIDTVYGNYRAGIKLDF